jgi:hypothetical protein
MWRATICGEAALGHEHGLPKSDSLDTYSSSVILSFIDQAIRPVV